MHSRIGSLQITVATFYNHEHNRTTATVSTKVDGDLMISSSLQEAFDQEINSIFLKSYLNKLVNSNSFYTSDDSEVQFKITVDLYPIGVSPKGVQYNHNITTSFTGATYNSMGKELFSIIFDRLLNIYSYKYLNKYFSIC